MTETAQKGRPMNILVEEVQKRRELDQIRDLYVNVLGARPTAVPDRPDKDAASQILVAKNPQKSGILGGLTLNRNHDGVDQLARRRGGKYANQWANDYPLLTHLAVKPEHQGQGIGSALLRRAVELVKYRSGKMIWGFAEIHDQRPSAAFYERNGFTIHDDDGAGTFKVGDVQHAASVSREGQFFTLAL